MLVQISHLFAHQKIVQINFMPDSRPGARKKKIWQKIRNDPRPWRENLICKNIILCYRNLREEYTRSRRVQFNLYHWFFTIECPFQKSMAHKRWIWMGLKKRILTPKLWTHLCGENSTSGLQVAAFSLCPYVVKILFIPSWILIASPGSIS